MNNNPNLNPGNPNGVNPNISNQPQGTPGINQVPAAPANPNISANPNLTAPANPVPNPNMVNNPGAPAPVPAPVPNPNMVPGINPNMPNPTPMPNPNAPAGQVLNPNLNQGTPQAMPAQAPMANPNMAPGTNPNMPNPNGPLPGMAPVQGGMNAVQPAQVVNPSIPNANPTSPTPNMDGDNSKASKFDTKTIILLIVALLSVVFCIVYFVFLNPNKKKPAPVTNTNQNQTENVANNTENTNTATNTNTTPEPEEPEEIDDYDMSWMGSYSNDDAVIAIYYSSPKAVDVEITKGSSSEQISIDVESLKSLKYDGDFLGNTLKFEINKTENGIDIKSQSTDRDSAFNIEGEFTKEEYTTNDWSGFYEVEGGQIIINEIADNGGRIAFFSESGKNSTAFLTYELKNNTITIDAKSFTKDDTIIKKDGDKLIVTSDEYLAGTYTKLK